MHQVKYRIKTLAPVVISTTFGETNTVNTDNYIPGTTVLGMLAWRYLKRDNFNESDKNEAADELFYRLFLDGAITFTNAYLTLKNRYDENVIYYPTPLSFRKDKSEKDIYDLLFVRDDFEKQTLPIGQFIDKDDLQEAQVALELNHHHKRDRTTGTPAEGLLFTYEAIASDQVFSGKLMGQESDLQIILNACGSKWIGHMGRSRNSQYGMVEFSFDAIEPVEADFQLDEDVRHDKPIVLTMLSHTLIYNKCGFATTELNELQKHLHGAQINRAVVKSRHIENFVSVWKFKKPAETGFAAGSCFLLDITNADTEKLFNLQLTGLGERIHEGFGQIQLELAENKKEESFYLNPTDNPEMEKPGKTVPSRVNTIVKEIVDEAIDNKIYLLAAEEFEEFKNLPTGSLIRRLEMFLNSRKNEIDKFIDDINSFKDTATAQMERCNNKEVTFKSFLQRKSFEINDILNRPDMAAIQKICNEIDYQPQHTPNEIAYLYFRAFLSQMRKRKKFIQTENIL